MTRRASGRPFVLAIIAALAVTILPRHDVQPALAVSSDLVISQVYGGGGNTGAVYTHDFIEVFNRGSAPVALAGKSVQYASATGTGNFGGTAQQITPLPAMTLQPGQYILIQESAGAGNGVGLPLQDVIDATPIAMSGTSGKVALVNSAASLGCNGGSTPCSADQLALIIDLVGYGGANFFEGAPTADLSNSTAAIRDDAGCAETDHNANDFTVATPTPRNSASAVHVCPADAAPFLQASTPVNAATSVAVDANVSLTFSETVDVTGSWFTIECTSGTRTAGVTGGPTTFTLDPTTDFASGDSCTVTVLAANVTDQDATDPPNQPDANASVTFSVVTVDPCAATFTPIYSIQGGGTTAAITGNVTTQGVVVGDFDGPVSSGIQGFYLQDAAGDGSAATSDGIFVYTGNATPVEAGDLVRVTGFARERFSQTTLNGSNSNTAATTQIVVCGDGPAVGPADVTLPTASATALEPYEGMLVRFPQTLVIAEYFNYDRFGELVLALPLDGEDRPFTGTAIDEPGAAANARTAANMARRITLDDAINAQNPPVLRHPNGDPFSLTNRFRGGDTVANAAGVLGYDFNLYRIYPTAPADYAAVNLRPAEPEVVGGTLRAAALNTLNFFLTLDTTASDSGSGPCGGNQNLDCRGADADQPDEFTRQRDKLLATLAGLDADVIGLNELENTPGVEPLLDPVRGIVAGLNAMPGVGPYSAIDTGVIGTDAIRVGLIYRSDIVTPVGPFRILDSSVDPRFIDSRSRPVLAQTFEEIATGARITVAVNHLKSKGSACTDIGDPDVGDGQGNCNLTRTAAAEALVDWLATDPTGSGDRDFLILGDLNSYARENPVDAIRAGADDVIGTSDDFTNLIAAYQGAYAHSYVFDGQAGYLDHALASATLVGQVTGAADWHINADEPDVLDYDTTFKPAAQDALYEANAYRSSDHDPVVVGLQLLAYDFSGFFRPIDNPPTRNTVKAGQSIPVKFSLGEDLGLGVFFETPTVAAFPCGGGPTGTTTTTTTAGGSGLTHDPVTNAYTYVWKTQKAWAGQCMTLVVTFDDGTYRTADFHFRS